MIKVFLVILFCLVATGCVKNPQLKAVLDDLETTPRCNTEPVLTDPRDTKDTLSAKLLITNYKLASCADQQYYQDKKLKTYRKL